MVVPDPVMLAYLRAPARVGTQSLAVDDLPIVDRPCSPAEALGRWPLPLVVSQAADLAGGGGLHAPVGNVVCDRCGSVLGQRIVWADRPAMIGLVRGRRWSLARSWGRRPVSAVLAARQRTQWFCLLDHPDTPAHLPLSCRAHGPMSVPSATVRAAADGEALAVSPPGYH